jgi:hypothetical protein
VVEVKLRNVAVTVVAVTIAVVSFWWAGLRQPLKYVQRPSGLPQNEISAVHVQQFLARRNPPLPFEAPLQWPSSPLHPAGQTLSEASVEERKAYSDSLRDDSAGLLLERWLSESQNGQDNLKLDFIADALATRLRAGGDDAAAAVARMAEFAREANYDLLFRWRMVQTLGEAATPTALRALLELAESAEKPGNLEPIVMHQIAGAGEIQWEGRFHEELSPVLEDAWVKPGMGDALSAAIANAMADVGSPASIELLIRESVLAGPSLSEFEQRDGSRGWQAYQALEKVRNAECVPILTRYLNEGRPGDVSMIAAGQALASMGRPEATAALLEWSRSSPADVSAFIGEWMSIMRDPVSADLAADAAASGSYANLSNQAALQVALAEWSAHRSK